MVLRLSAGMLNSLIARQIDVAVPVRDVILGASVSGTAQVTGRPHVDLEPCADQAQFVATITGCVNSQTRSYTGPVTIYGGSVTHFTATARVAFDPGKGFYAGTPQIAATTRVHTDRIDVNRGGLIGRIIQRRAWDQVSAQKTQLTAIARQRATARIAVAFERHLDERIAELNRAVEFRTIVASFRDQAEGTPQLACSTTRDYLEMADTLASDRSRIDLPVLSSASSANAPIEIWIHQRLMPEGLSKVLKEALSSPDQNAVLQTLVTLPTPLGKEAAAGLASFLVRNQIEVQTLGDWTVVELNARSEPQVAVVRSIQR